MERSAETWRSAQASGGLVPHLWRDPGESRTDGATGAQLRVSLRSQVRREYFQARDPFAVQRSLANAYPDWRFSGSFDGAHVIHRRCGTAAVTVDDVRLSGHVGCAINPSNRVVVLQAASTSPQSRVDAPPRWPNNGEPVLAAPGLPRVLQLDNISLHVLSIGLATLQHVAVELGVPLPATLRFLDAVPTAIAERTWRRSLKYFHDTLIESSERPLVVNAAIRMIAAALLECFPNNVGAQADSEVDESAPHALADAVSFINRNADNVVGVNEIAAALHITPRSVQYLFRRHLDTTPSEFVRRARLQRAHLDLVAAKPTETTVSAIARRWGFAHTGRFAVLYRQTYGQSPHTTLRQGN